MSGAYKDADPDVNKDLKNHYREEELEKHYLIEPCQFVGARTRYFKRGKMGGEGTTRYYKPGWSVPALIKPSLKEFAYAVALRRVPREVEMNLIHDINRLEDEIRPDIDELIEGALGYVDKYVIPKINMFRRDYLIEDLRNELESLVQNTRFNS
jgi:hypothetical protein